jgi:hypothetical protein
MIIHESCTRNILVVAQEFVRYTWKSCTEYLFVNAPPHSIAHDSPLACPHMFTASAVTPADSHGCSYLSASPVYATRKSLMAELSNRGGACACPNAQDQLWRRSTRGMRWRPVQLFPESKEATHHVLEIDHAP